MEVERKRPIKLFRVTQAFGPYVKGQTIQPTGMYRDVLLRRGVIAEIKDGSDDPPERQARPQTDRMVRLPEKGEAGPLFGNRTESKGKGRR